MSMVRTEPPWLTKRSTTLVLATPEDVPILMLTVQPALADAQSGIAVHVVELALLDHEKSATAGLAAVAVRTAY